MDAQSIVARNVKDLKKVVCVLINTEKNIAKDAKDLKFAFMTNWKIFAVIVGADVFVVYAILLKLLETNKFVQNVSLDQITHLLSRKSN